MKRFFVLLGRNRGFFLFALTVGLVYSAVSVVLPTISGKLITSVVSNLANSTMLLCLFLAVSVAQIGLSELDKYAGGSLKMRQKGGMRKTAFRAFLQNDGAKAEDISGFVSFVNNDIPSVAEQYFLGTIDIIKCVAIILMSAVSLVFIHWLLALIIAGISVLIVLLPNAFRKQGGIARKEYSSKLARYNTTLNSILNGLHIVKAYRCQRYVTKSADSANDDITKSEGALLKRQLIVQGITTFLQVAKTALILIVGIVLISQRKIDVGSLVAAIQLADIMSAPIEVLAYLRHARNEVLPLLEQYETMTTALSDESARTDSFDVRDGLSVCDLTYRVGGLEILKGVSARFESGGKYLITGESGSGKSTLLRLIAQTGDIGYGGAIRFGEHEIRGIPYSSYYGAICPVFQEPYLVHASLRENVCLGRDIPEDVYRAAVEKLGLSYLLERYGDRELTPEIVETLSGGERQRVAIARAMVGKPSVYLLDEVTSALDSVNSELVEVALLDEPATILHVCHKPNPAFASRYDGRLEMAEGKLS